MVSSLFRNTLVRSNCICSSCLRRPWYQRSRPSGETVFKSSASFSRTGSSRDSGRTSEAVPPASLRVKSNRVTTTGSLDVAIEA